jgi:large subunit ribosomal protein L6
MSHIGKKPIPIPSGVTITQDKGMVVVKGPKGELSFEPHRAISVVIEDNQIVCSIGKQTKQSAALWGTTRARLANMVKGVTEGFRRQLELHGVGYRAQVKGKDLEMTLGFSHPVKIAAPAGITFTVNKEVIDIEGINNELVGQVAAEIRAWRPPEPYKGKGVHYMGEHVRRKVGKVVGSTT